jgi:DNA-binding CsgD family transcriptional regulator
LEHRNEEKLRIQDNVVSAVSKLVTPFVEKLNKTDLDGRQKTYLGVIESNLDEIVSPLAARLFHRHANLTPRELEVVNLVRAGKSIIETAELLHLSEDTIGFHRKNIRAKLGLKHKKISLFVYLQQLALE